MKPVDWLGDSLARLREFPRHAMREAGHQLELVQDGREPLSIAKDHIGRSSLKAIGCGKRSSDKKIIKTIAVHIATSADVPPSTFAVRRVEFKTVGTIEARKC